MEAEYCVIGGGIVGLGTALALLERIASKGFGGVTPRTGAKVVVVEKEGDVARHQTGHNSGVIHAGIYYKPGSLKAKLCREGAEATRRFCRDHGIPFETRGKLLVATSAVELARMDDLERRAGENGIPVERLDEAELKRREPNISGLGALFVPASGIVDYARICRTMADVMRQRGGEIVLGAAVTAIDEKSDAVHVEAGGRRIRAQRLIACAGLQSDRIARLAGVAIEHSIVPFRGEYYELPASRAGIVKHLIYPIPDPDLPFLGIHLTPMIDGSVTVGPNAVLGFSREGYAKGSFNGRDVAAMAGYAGFWRMAKKYWRSAMTEFGNSLLKRRYLEECRKYCPSLTLADLAKPTAGIRAQAVLHDGTLVHDFLFKSTPRMLHVCNAPSPAATSALPIGRMIVDTLMEAEHEGAAST